MYCELADLKIYLGISVLDDVDDELMERLLAASQRAIDTFCHQSFEASADTTRYFDAYDNVDGAMLCLDAPLCAITSITNGDGTTVTAGQYVTEPRNYRPWYALTLKSNSGLAWTYTDTPENAIAIVGKWAYSEVAPDDIVQATIRMASYLYRQKDNQSSDLDRPLMAGGGVVLLPSRLPDDLRSLLTPYRRML